MHLLIGTQRPSVDVITGLIKANIPSRIAFTVASQVDSRTIIDIVGAEKLIGRGDMLFAPVGAMKPIRVQGAFVSDKEVNEITDFIRSQGTAEYDEEVINMIDKEAEQCGQPKRKGGAAAEQADDGDDELDPRFWEAVKVAVDMKKISTSLLQRTMSLGYGRAAKIIDAMQKMGIVTPQDGAKAREVLIDRSQYEEMMIRRNDG
jgi:S-DNA-T family DNA segregation ATPase FtsK/SpoIIIE